MNAEPSTQAARPAITLSRPPPPMRTTAAPIHCCRPQETNPWRPHFPSRDRMCSPDATDVSHPVRLCSPSPLKAAPLPSTPWAVVGGGQPRRLRLEYNERFWRRAPCLLFLDSDGRLVSVVPVAPTASRRKEEASSRRAAGQSSRNQTVRSNLPES